MRARLLGPRVALGAILLVVPACQLATDFAIEPVAETSEALCRDGRDGDFDGLSDCQDWGCLGQVACCDIPEILIDERFDRGPASCDEPACADATCAEDSCGPDLERWHTWPCPRPTVCGGALHIGKTQCFAGGVLSKGTAALGPGLIVTAEVRGRPERLGYAEVALTLQDELTLPGSLDPCGRLQNVNGFAAARIVWAERGSQIIALFREKEVGRSAPIPDPDAPHALVIAVDRDRRVTYTLDGQLFATADVPVPTSDRRARIALTGLTDAVSFGALRVEAGIRCHDPSSFVPRGDDVEASVVLAGDTVSPSAFDEDEVYHPVLRRAEEGLEVFYTGCYWPGDAPACNEFGVAIGRTLLGAGGLLERDAARNPWLVPADLTAGGVNASDPEASLGLAGGPVRAGYVPLFVGQAKGLIGLDDALAPIAGSGVLPAAQGAWDEGEVCCAEAHDGPDGVRRVYYAARVEGTDRTWRIGLATSTDGATFVREGTDPVLAEGPPEAFDGGGVSNPAVVYDPSRGIYRMWYEGRDFFGRVRIGYAVSTDGVRWSRSPDNPVVTPEELGLTTVGGPTVERQADGRLLMFVHGTTVSNPRRRIFALVNEGRIPDAP